MASPRWGSGVDDYGRRHARGGTLSFDAVHEPALCKAEDAISARRAEMRGVRIEVKVAARPVADKRCGFPRDSMCDVGAFEVQP